MGRRSKAKKVVTPDNPEESGLAWDGSCWRYFKSYQIIPKGKYKGYVRIESGNGKIFRIPKDQIGRMPVANLVMEKKP